MENQKEIFNIVANEKLYSLFQMLGNKKSLLLLKSLPKTQKELGKLLELSPMPVSIRVQAFRHIGIIQQKYGKEIEITETGQLVLDKVDEIRNRLKANLGKK